MKLLVRFLIAFALTYSILFSAFAQVDKYPYVEIALGSVQYAVSGDESKGNLVYKDLSSGMSIPLFSTIRTGPDGYVEISLAPNKVIKIYEFSTVSLAKFQTDSSVELKVGKLKAKVKKVGTLDEFKVRTETGIAAVRGTEFGVIYNTGQASMMQVFVKEGVVSLTDPTGRTVDINAGYSSSISRYLNITEIEEPKPISPEEFEKYFADKTQTQEPQEQPQKVEEKKEEKKEPVPPSPKQAPGTQPSTPSEKQEEPATPKFNFGWGISSENIDGVVWNKIILSPIFYLGKFGVGLYIVSYWDGKNNIYDTTKWYNAKEYDFGFHQDGFDIGDFGSDLLSKILFLSYGSKGDKVFIRLGNIPDMTLGHGFIFDRYSNMLGFPAVRKVGLQFDLDFGVYGFETVFSDLSRTRLFGMRHYVRPLYGTPVLGNLGFGVSGAIDLEPFILSNQAFEGNPSVFFVGADVDFPVFDIYVLSLTIFADVAKAGIYINNTNENPYLSSLIATKGYQNGFNLLDGYGLSAGIKGTIIGALPWKIEYRRTEGNFIPSYFDTLYDAQKSGKLISLLTLTPPPFNGILGGLGVKVEGIAEGNIEYEQLWPQDSDFSGYSINRLIGRFKVDKQIIKTFVGVPVYGKLTYQRNNIPSISDFFSDALKDSTATLEIAYSVSEDLDISIAYKRFFISSTEYQDSVSIQLRSSIFGELGF
jgi:hypothetical protein